LSLNQHFYSDLNGEFAHFSAVKQHFYSDLIATWQNVEVAFVNGLFGMDDETRQSVDETRIDAVHDITPTSVAVVRQIAYILRPMVQLLLTHGGTYPQLAETLKSVFIEVARSDTEQNAWRMTDSKLAVKTGLRRQDIKRLCAVDVQMESRGSSQTSVSLTSAVFTRWLSDSAYCDKDGKPKTLQRLGNSPHSFGTLVKSISTNVHPRTVLNELGRLGLVDIEGDSIHPKVDAFVPKSDFAQMLEYFGANLHDHAATAVRNMLDEQPAFLEQSLFNNGIHAEAVEELAGLARQKWTNILKTVMPKVERHELSEQDGKEQVGAPHPQRARVRVGMYFYAEDEQLNTQARHAKSSDRRKK
jgi:hypothetical protein